MALDPGGAGAAGSLPPPPPSPPSVGGVPQSGVGGPLAHPLINSLMAFANAPTTTLPDYNALLNNMMAPYEALQQQQLAAMRDQMAHERGFAEEAYGINKGSAEDAHNEMIRRIIATLTARGMIQSGDKQFLTTNENTRYDRQLGLLTNSLQQYLYGLTSALQNAQLQSQSSIAMQRMALGPQLQAAYPPVVSYPHSNLLLNPTGA